jgi:hypothetical protein
VVVREYVLRCFLYNGLDFLMWRYCFLYLESKDMFAFRDMEGGGFYVWRFVRRVLKIALGNMVWLSFKWLLAVNSA